MTQALHVEGMGVIGSILAWRLAREGIGFTWNDSERNVNAWQACTGAIYPSGKSTDMTNYETWRQWLAGAAPWLPRLQEATCIAPYWFLSKYPPHGAKYKIAEERAGLKRAELPSMHFNAQTFIPATREVFSKGRVERAPKGALIVRAHGFTERLSHYLWGWTVLVELDCGAWGGDAKPCFYLREGRFKLTYAYPVPGTPFWYAGSSLITQMRPKELDVLGKLNRWYDHLRAVTGEGLKLRSIGTSLQGWRPVPFKGDDAPVRWVDDKLCVAPLWHSGVRHAPGVVEAVVREVAGCV